jgi:hypothetical protein
VRVGHVLAGGKVREGLVFEVADGELDDGVLAVLGLDDLEVVAAVGQKREVPPVWPEFSLVSDQAGAANDQALGADHRLGDLRLAIFGVVLQGLPVGLGIAQIAALMCGCWRTPIE